MMMKFGTKVTYHGLDGTVIARQVPFEGMPAAYLVSFARPKEDSHFRAVFGIDVDAKVGPSINRIIPEGELIVNE